MFIYTENDYIWHAPLKKKADSFVDGLCFKESNSTKLTHNAFKIIIVYVQKL